MTDTIDIASKPEGIGSEFVEPDVTDTEMLMPEDARLLLSGRTALDHIIKDIEAGMHINSILMPDYCCDSMLDPFIANDIEIVFYHVEHAEGSFHYCIPDLCADAILIMQYFGFRNDEEIALIEELSKRMIVIEDATHSFFQQTGSYSRYSDYVFASLRKWTGLTSGAVTWKNKGKFKIAEEIRTNEKFDRSRETAQHLKKKYIDAGEGDKQGFLDDFSHAEKMLDVDYKGYAASDKISNEMRHINDNMIYSQRAANARALIDGLRSIEWIDTMAFNEGDTPIFVPLFIENEIRDRLKQHLISNGIFCPCHWPGRHGSISQRELSLICDQRYDEDDMRLILLSIKEFWER